MTALPVSARPFTGQGIADGLRAVRLIVMAFLVLDVVVTLVGQAYGVAGLGPAGVLPTTQQLAVVAASAATLWGRPRVALVLAAVVVTLVFTVGSTGADLWLLVVTGVTAAARARPRVLGLVVLAQLAYGVAFGLRVESQNPGWGWSAGLVTGGFSTASLAAGLVARRLLRIRDERRRQVLGLERENGRIRAIERARLAEDLQSVVTGGLAAIAEQIDRVTRCPADREVLRRGLARIDVQSRTLLTEMRALLDVLRAPLDPPVGGGPDAQVPGPRRWVDLVTARHVRIAAAVVLGLLAARAAVGDLGSSTPSVAAVQALGLVACAVAVWRPVVGAGCAAAALVVSLALDPPGYWDALPAALLCLMEPLRRGRRRLGLVVLAVGAYGALLASTDAPDPLVHLLVLGYVGLGATLAGLAARHFVEAGDHSSRQLVDLISERERLTGEERSAVARELHDVVAHQLSVTTMLVMATSCSDDPAVLADTLARVRRSTEAAQQELSTLLYAMRGPAADQQQPTPLVTPTANAAALARQLTDNGYQVVLDVDAAADHLDATTQRTVSRIMREATTNILRYTPAGATCRYTLTVDVTTVGLRITSPWVPSGRRSDLSLGWGLRGIRERVDLTGGTFTAGPRRDQWVLAVTLPVAVRVRLAPPDVAPATPAPPVPA